MPLSQGLEDTKLQRQALNLGLVVAYVLRITLILTATWVANLWQFELELLTCCGWYSNTLPPQKAMA